MSSITLYNNTSLYNGKENLPGQICETTHEIQNKYYLYLAF